MVTEQVQFRVLSQRHAGQAFAFAHPYGTILIDP
jgi:hypothetical protein